MHLLPNHLGPLADIAAKEGTARYSATSGVKIDLETPADSPPFWRAVATDGRRLIITSAPVEFSANEYPPIPALESAPNGELSAIVPAKEWKSIFADCAKRVKKMRTGKPILKSVAAVIGANVSSFAATDLETNSFHQPRNLDGRFPDYTQVYEPNYADTAAYAVAVDPYLLAETLETIAKIGCEDNGQRVDIFFQPDNTRPFMIRARNVQKGQETLGVIVPLANKDGQRAVSTPHDTLADTLRELETARSEIERLNNRIGELEDENLKLFNDLDDARDAAERAKENEQSADRNAHETSTETEALADQLVSAQDRIHDLEKEAAELKKDFERAEKFNGELEDQLQEAKDRAEAAEQDEDHVLDLESKSETDDHRTRENWKRIEAQAARIRELETALTRQAAPTPQAIHATGTNAADPAPLRRALREIADHCRPWHTQKGTVAARLYTIAEEALS